MRHAAWVGLAALILFPSLAPAGGLLCGKKGACCPLAGQVIDYTCNHGVDRRLFSEALQCKRDLYVYLPPCYDPKQSYPVMIYLHGYLEDERSFVENIARPLDRAIQAGLLPPMIAAAPDGTLSGEPVTDEPGSFFINSRAGRFEDWIMIDVWNFVLANYSVRPEREAHVIAGSSMGGFGAYNLALKHRDKFKIVIGILPVLNLRWVDCHCRYFGNFNPCCWGWRTSNENPCEVLGKFCCCLIKVRMQDVIYPVFGRGPAALAFASQENPIEMVDRLSLQPGELDMFVGYAGKDNFNLDAHAESFLYTLRCRGIGATVCYSRWGHHNEKTALSMLPCAIQFLGAKLGAEQGTSYPVDLPK